MKKKNVLDIVLQKKGSCYSSKHLLRYYLGGLLVGETYQDKKGNHFFKSFGTETPAPSLQEAEEGIKRRAALFVIAYLKENTDVKKYLPKNNKS